MRPLTECGVEVLDLVVQRILHLNTSLSTTSVGVIFAQPEIKRVKSTRLIFAAVR